VARVNPKRSQELPGKKQANSAKKWLRVEREWKKAKKLPERKRHRAGFQNIKGEMCVAQRSKGKGGDETWPLLRWTWDRRKRIKGKGGTKGPQQHSPV